MRSPDAVGLRGSWSVQVLEEPRDLAALRVEWRGLRADFDGPANTLDWCVAFAQRPPGGQRPCVIVLRDHGRLRAVAPLQRATARDGTLRLVNEDDASGLLYANEDALDRLLRVMLALGRPLVLKSLLVGSRTERMLRARLRRRLHLHGVHAWTMGPTVDLDERFADPRTTLVGGSGGARCDGEGRPAPMSSRSFRRKLRKAEALGTVGFHVDPIGDDVEERLAEVVRVEGSGWKGRERSGLAHKRSQRETLRRFVCSPEIRDHVRIGAMRINGRAVAVDVVVTMSGRLWGLKRGFDEAYASVSPGMLLTLHLLSWARHHGFGQAEFMGKMDEWKRGWGEGRTLHHVRVYPRTPRGVLALGRDLLSREKVTCSVRVRFEARREAVVRALRRPRRRPRRSG